MAIINYINTGSGANSGDGDSLRTAFTKINLNFDSLVSNFVAAGVTSWNNRVGIVEFTNEDLLTLLGYTPYPNTNPDGFVTSSTIASSNYAIIDYVNTAFVFVSDLAAYNFASTNYVDLKLTEYPTLQYLDDQQYLTSINLPNFLTSYITVADLAGFGNSLRDFTTNTVFQSVNNSNIVPSVADTYNLGDEAYRWSTLYLSNAVYIQGIGIGVDPTTGRLLVDGNPVTGNFSFDGSTISRSDQSTFTISNNNGIPASTAWLQIPSPTSNDLESASLINNGAAGVSLVSGSTQLRLSESGVLILGNLSLPLKLQGIINTNTSLTTNTTLLVSGDHYIEIKGNTWIRTFYDEDVPVPQSIASYQDANTLTPLNLKGNIVSLISNTLTDITRELDIEFSGMLGVSQQGVYVGVTDTEGSGNPANADSSFEGYKLPLTRGQFGQILAITSTATYVDTVEWVTPSGGTSADLLNVGNHILPSANLTYDLGSTSSQWRSLYVGTSTIYLGGTALSVSGGNLTVDGSPVAGGASTNQLVSTQNSNTFSITDSGDVVFSGEIPGGVNRGLVWDYGANINSGTNSMIRQDQAGLTVRAWTEIGMGIYSAPVNIVTNQDADQKTWEFDGNGVLALPAGGTITEGVVTSNPTIQLTPATPTVASQKLVIKGGGNYNAEANGIALNHYQITAIVGDTIQIYVYSLANANQTLYWWIHPAGANISAPGTGTVILNGSGSGDFSFMLDSDNYEFTVRVSPTDNVYDPETTGVETLVFNANAPAYGDHHLHLTTGDLAETSIFLGTDNHNVRTTVNGSIEITTPNVSNNVWNFGTDGSLTVPGSIIPNVDIAYNLGSPTNRFNDLYLNTSTIYIGTSTITVSGAGQMLVNGNDAVSKLEYFGGEGVGPRDAGSIEWNTSTFTFNIPGKELLLAIYDLKPGNKIRAANTFGFDQEFTIVGNARQYTRGFSNEFLMAAVDVAETTSTGIYAFSLYLPVKDKTATLANGTWTVAVTTTGTITLPDGTEQSTAYNPNSIGLTWIIGANGSSDYTFSGPGIYAGNTNDPILYLYRGFTYKFNNTTGSSHPFAIRVSNGGAAYTTGVSGSQTGIQTFTVPMNAPSTLYYQCTIHSSMGNTINIV